MRNRNTEGKVKSINLLGGSDASLVIFMLKSKEFSREEIRKWQEKRGVIITLHKSHSNIQWMRELLKKNSWLSTLEMICFTINLY